MKIGSTDIADVKIGGTDVQKVYAGDSLIWERNTAPLWTPEQITTYAWYDVFDSQHYVDAGAGSVSQLIDRSGNNRNMVADTANRAIIEAIGSNNYLKFDGVDDYYAHAASISYPAEIFMIFQPNGGVSTTVAGFFLDTAFDQYNCISTSSTNQVQIVSRSGTIARANVTVFTNGDIIMLHGKFTSEADRSGAINGGGYVSNTTVLTASTFNSLALGRLHRSSPTQYYGGKIGEVIFRNSLLGQDDTDRVIGYMAHRWGLASLLPSGHPYKSTAPTSSFPYTFNYYLAV